MAVSSAATQLGTALPDVTLPDLDGNAVRVPDLVQNRTGVVVVFACNHCPYVRHLEHELAVVAAESAPDVAFVAIMSNDVAAYPDDDVAGLRDQADRAGWSFPYLIDTPEHRAAKAFGAVCTPDFFAYDAAGLLAYRGAFDASSPKNGEPLTGDLLRGAIAAIRAGQPVPLPHRPAMGCGLKWRPGHEPAPVTFS